MNRKKAFLLNSFSGLLRQLISLICGFVMTKLILDFYGSSMNGLVSSITQFLGFISFLEMGIGPVIQSNLYRPLAEKKDVDISKIIKSSETFFKRIVYIFMVYIGILCVLFPILSNSEFAPFFTASLVLIISLSSLAQYYFGMTYQLLLNADQKGYVQSTLQWVTLVVNTVLCIVLMNLGASIHIVRLITATVYVFRPLFLNVYVKKHYNIDKNVNYNDDPIKQKWNGFAQHLAAVVVDNTDIAVLTIMSSLQNVSVYVIYFNVVYGITQIIMTVVSGLEAMWGNMLAKKEWSIVRDSFSLMEWGIHTIVTIIFAASALLITPFVLIYTSGIEDANYNQPLFGVILVFAFAMQCIRVPYFRLIKAAGHYKQTQNGAFISMVLNILISIIIVKKFGLVGVAIGTYVALFFHTCYLVVYLSHHLLKRNILFFIKHLIIDIMVLVISFLLCNLHLGVSKNYVSWVIMATKITSLVVAISTVANLVFYREFINRIIIILKKRITG